MSSLYLYMIKTLRTIKCGNYTFLPTSRRPPRIGPFSDLTVRSLELLAPPSLAVIALFRRAHNAVTLAADLLYKCTRHIYYVDVHNIIIKSTSQTTITYPISPDRTNTLSYRNRRYLRVVQNMAVHQIKSLFNE